MISSSSSSLPLRIAFLVSLSIASTASPFRFPPTNTKRKPVAKSSYSYSPAPSPSSSPRPKATVSDLLSQQAQSVNPQVRQELWSCFKFLVPYNNQSHTPITDGPSSSSNKLRLPSTRRRKQQQQEDVDELILSPPAPVLELARLAVDSGADPAAIHRADPAAIHRALDPSIIPVPDVEGSNEDRCELTRTPYGRRFINEVLNSYLELLFEIIVERGPSVGLNVNLSRYDFFHGHLFLAKDCGRLGILFHAKEYPAYDKHVFPYNMGYCQVGSDVTYDDSMNLRNILWLAPLPSNSTKTWLAPGVLVVLDAHPEGIIYQDLVPEYVNFARTLYEEDFGEVVVDVHYLNVGAQQPNFQIFIC